jgi:hypothetical protein
MIIQTNIYSEIEINKLEDLHKLKPLQYFLQWPLNYIYFIYSNIIRR